MYPLPFKIISTVFKSQSILGSVREANAHFHSIAHYLPMYHDPDSLKNKMAETKTVSIFYV